MKITVSPRYDGHYYVRIECDDNADKYSFDKIAQRTELKHWLSWLDVWCYSAPRALDSYELPKETKDFLYSEHFDNLVKRMCPGAEIVKY